MLQDKIMAIIALLTMIVFIASVPIFVPDIDLILVTALISALAAYDFWRLLKERDKKD